MASDDLALINVRRMGSFLVEGKINRGGRREIRTLERREPLLVFETSAFNHSASLPIANAPWSN